VNILASIYVYFPDDILMIIIIIELYWIELLLSFFLNIYTLHFTIFNSNLDLC
jgi:hypothetical protein